MKALIELLRPCSSQLGSIFGSEFVLTRDRGGEAPPRPPSSLFLFLSATGSEACRWICSKVILEEFPEGDERLLLRTGGTVAVVAADSCCFILLPSLLIRDVDQIRKTQKKLRTSTLERPLRRPEKHLQKDLEGLPRPFRLFKAHS